MTEFAQRADAYPRVTHGQPTAGDRVQHPRRQNNDVTRLGLDVYKLARSTHFHGLTANRMPVRADATDSGQRRQVRHGQNGCQIVVGCKNHYGSCSKRGTEVAALFYTLVNLCAVSPRAYVIQAAIRAIQSPSAVTLPSDLT